MNKVLILGCCGAGKSTFAKQLQAATGLPLIHLDQVHWLPNWVELDHDSFLQKLEPLVEQPRWIMDGNFAATLDVRLAKADTVIYLDTPTWKCLWRVVKRVWKYNGRPRPDMPEGCNERWDWEFIHYVIAFNSVKRPKIMRQLEAAAATKTIRILKTDREVAAYLQSFAPLSNSHKMINIHLAKGWIFSNIEGVRELEEGTYSYFNYDELPSIEIELDDEFNWLKPYPKYSNEEYQFQNQLKSLKEEALKKGFELPISFIKFMENSSLIRRIRSNTDCYFELGDCIEKVNDDVNLIHFLSDSQYCCFWFLCFKKNGNHSVIYSENLFGHLEEDYNEFRAENEAYLYECADSFNEFIYRFWIENEISFKTYDDLTFSNLEQRYCNHYLK